MKNDHEIIRGESSGSWIRKDFVRIRLLWVGLVTLCMILLNDFRYVKDSPIYVIVLGCLINGGLIVVFVLEIRKINKRLRDKAASGAGEAAQQ